MVPEDDDVETMHDGSEAVGMEDPAAGPPAGEAHAAGTSLMVILPPVTCHVFDYSQLPEEVADAAQEAVIRIRDSLGYELLATMEAGGELLRVKELLGHGHFGAWLRCEFQMSQRTAAYYMQMHRAFGSELEMVANLPLALVRELSRPAITEETRRAFVEQATAGQTPTVAEIRTAANRLRLGRKGAELPSSWKPKPAATRQDALQQVAAMIRENFRGDLAGC